MDAAALRGRPQARQADPARRRQPGAALGPRDRRRRARDRRGRAGRGGSGPVDPPCRRRPDHRAGAPGGARRPDLDPGYARGFAAELHPQGQRPFGVDRRARGAGRGRRQPCRAGHRRPPLRRGARRRQHRDRRHAGLGSGRLRPAPSDGPAPDPASRLAAGRIRGAGAGGPARARRHAAGLQRRQHRAGVGQQPVPGRRPARRGGRSGRGGRHPGRGAVARLLSEKPGRGRGADATGTDAGAAPGRPVAVRRSASGRTRRQPALWRRRPGRGPGAGRRFWQPGVVRVDAGREQPDARHAAEPAPVGPADAGPERARGQPGAAVGPVHVPESRGLCAAGGIRQRGASRRGGAGVAQARASPGAGRRHDGSARHARLAQLR
ncbi:Uncharacterised protein [Achromobacter sp. 2789STDY5608615]|nr:Uncharacterised protein [Achromobacter sp. 2789STDY5608615]